MVFKFAQALAGACLLVLAHQPAAFAQAGGTWVDPPANIDTGPRSPEPQAPSAVPDNPPPPPQVTAPRSEKRAPVQANRARQAPGRATPTARSTTAPLREAAPARRVSSNARAAAKQARRSVIPRDEGARRSVASRREWRRVVQRRVEPKSVRISRPARYVEYEVENELVEYEVLQPPIMGYPHRMGPALGLLPLSGYLGFRFR